MNPVDISFGQEQTRFIFDGQLKDLPEFIGNRQAVIVTDSSVAYYYGNLPDNLPVITLPSGEASKASWVVDSIIKKLLDIHADRNTLLIGFGGGVVTDITGFVAGIYKRGIACAFVPTTVLAMVDAAVGGKNGINFWAYKNMVGLVRQPEFILYDYTLLSTLTNEEWSNGFAEIIKHACIADKEMFENLLKHDLKSFQTDQALLSGMIRKNALLKAGIVQQDISEQGIRQQLNFGHTLGHALEMSAHLKHGFAVAVGMVFAAEVSKKELGFSATARLKKAVAQYGLPTHANYPPEKALALMKADKKRTDDYINFVLLKAIGTAAIRPLSFSSLKNYLG